MRFTLYYEGPLSTKGRTELKSQIRAHFDPQLRELWNHQPLSIHADDLLTPEGKISA